MTFIENYRDLQGIARGVKKAERDIQRIKDHISKHNTMHKLDEAAGGDWDCHDFNTKFFCSLGQDVEHDTAEAVGYMRGREKHQNELMQTATDSNSANHAESSGLTLIPFEMNGDEDQEDILTRVRQAIRDHEIFEEQVSETNQQNPDQKESK